MPTIVPIVEGDGDELAVPVLLRRLLHAQSIFDMQIARAVTAHGVGNLSTKLERFLRHAHGRPVCHGILVVQDGEGECPREIALGYVARARVVGCKCPVAFVIANRMYESWLVASLATVMCDAEPFDGDPEELHSPKAWLSDHMPQGLAYRETTDQAAMTVRLDPALARRCRSFRRLEAALDFLIDCIRTGKTGISPSS